ncbi:MAG: T9SS type A sorting domain-containing protein [Ignavibacteriae bacterium]|nr:T9SS type A sorting domain-containing protein [Ignavibacteriota bacterium]
MKRFSTIILSFLMFFSFLLVSTFAQWSHDPTVNNAICTGAYDQTNPTVTTDGAGGAIMTWEDDRYGTSQDIFAQRINNKGEVQWATNGVAICTAMLNQYSPTITSDGAGGAIITWRDSRGATDDIYAQRINSIGVVQWTANGVVISNAAKDEERPVIISDGSGGAIIVWHYEFDPNDIDLYAQRINSASVVQWTANGVPISTVPYKQQYPTLTSDGAGGAIITWHDFGNGNNWNIYAQRINSAGVVQWATNGVAISSAINDQTWATITSDGTGGAIIAWHDGRSGGFPDIYAQRINSAGEVQWTVDGVAISTAANSQEYPQITSDGVGGAIIAWSDTRSVNYDIYAQRINGGGVVQWTDNGTAISTATVHQYVPKIISDGTGGAIITWDDYRNGTDADIYAQRINGAGVVKWTTDGVAISTTVNQQDYCAITGDGTGGAIVTWPEDRGGTSNDIYAQKIDKFGYLGYNNPELVSVSDVPGDQGGKVTLRWNASSYDVEPYTVVTTYSIWRGVGEPSALAKLSQGIHINSSGEKYRIIQNANGTTTYWEYVGFILSHYFPQYSYTVATTSDSTSSGTPSFKFLVSAHTYNQFTFWDSNIDSGYSVDNLSPYAVTNLTAQSQPGPVVLLQWRENETDTDVSGHEVHRSPTSGFIPDGSTKLGETSDTVFIDDAPLSGGSSYYRIVTLDIHGNRSEPSAEASPLMQTTMQVNMQDKWNMVSVPLTVDNYSKTALFPSSVSDVFAFSGGYYVQQTLQNGAGYWLKFNGAQNVTMTGMLRTTETIDVSTGWNMIGSISSSVNTNLIGTVPAGLITSQFFGYSNGYNETSTIEPGKAYWVKVSQRGQLILSSVGSTQSSVARIEIIPTSELPPPPPEDDGNSNNTIIPSEFALEQNYPNPFNPSTVIRYQLPVDSRVTLKIYNVLGEEVTTLVDGVQDAGFQSVEWDAVSFQSGVYVYRLNVGNFSDVKRLILLR